MRGALFSAVCAVLLASTTRAFQTVSPSGATAGRMGLTTLYDSVLEARTSAVAAALRCPVCQGLSIQDSPSDLAKSMRSLVRQQLAEGKTPDQVKAYFVSRYGEWILLAPKASGFNLLAYVGPLLVVLGGGLVIALAIRRWTRNGAGSPANSP